MDTAIAGPTYENVLYGKKDGVAYVTLNRPKVPNALSAKTLAELSEVFGDAGKDPAITGVIFTGSGNRAYVASANISELNRLTAVAAEQFTRDAQAVFDLIENLGKPAIAAVNGFALGGGCEAAMVCTIRLGAEGPSSASLK